MRGLSNGLAGIGEWQRGSVGDVAVTKLFLCAILLVFRDTGTSFKLTDNEGADWPSVDRLILTKFGTSEC